MIEQPPTPYAALPAYGPDHVEIRIGDEVRRFDRQDSNTPPIDRAALWLNERRRSV